MSRRAMLGTATLVRRRDTQVGAGRTEGWQRRRPPPASLGGHGVPARNPQAGAIESRLLALPPAARVRRAPRSALLEPGLASRLHGGSRAADQGWRPTIDVNMKE